MASTTGNAHSLRGRLAAPIGYGILAVFVLLGVYFATLSLLSGSSYAWVQFSQFWYYVVALAAGFGLQVGLYVYLTAVAAGSRGAGKVVGVTGSTSSAAMLACCTHYLVHLLPILGATGIATFVTQYQVQFFWVGLLFSLAGTAYMARKVVDVQALQRGS